VIVPFVSRQADGLVVAARSLRLVEQREEQVLAIAVLGWLIALGGVAAAIAARLWPTAVLGGVRA
jgi:hypothetical protein